MRPQKRVFWSDRPAPFAFSSYFDIFESMKSQDAIQSLAALAQESRLAIFRILVKRGPEGYTPTQLGEKLSVSVSNAVVSSERAAGGWPDRCAPRGPISVLPAEFHPHEPADRISHRELLCPCRQGVSHGVQSVAD